MIVFTLNPVISSPSSGTLLSLNTVLKKDSALILGLIRLGFVEEKKNKNTAWVANMACCGKTKYGVRAFTI